MNIRKTYVEFFNKVTSKSEVAALLTIAQAINELNETIKERFPPLQLEEKIVCTKCGKLFSDKKITVCDKCGGRVDIYSGYIVT